MEGSRPIWSRAARDSSAVIRSWKRVSSWFCRLISFCMAMSRKADSTLAITSWAWKGLVIMSSAPRFRPPILEALPSMAETSTK